ncbi:helix-turn-helix domain-containing protein [Amycolatopsis rifamycinica]|uniref:XRE family transcriptional regulator n=1 Tax=Amycolatopsis rifamycinica TaxID=287986 RepID=A0A066U636_9PSEU|nr:helix-turn-helix transcriptional regulator [Amycolatopsis rifamycinica]KDN22555.1 XRE family transcriptional regulator [Amycolatopsis rifamycinica]
MSESVGERLRELRTERGLTQRELAGPQYSAAYVSSVETGVRTPSGDALRFFAQQLGVDPDELLGGRSPRELIELDLELIETAERFLAGDARRATPRMQRIRRRAERLDRPRQAGIALLWLAGYSTGDIRTKYVADAETALAGEPPPVRAMVVPLRAAVLTGWGEVQYSVHLLETCHAELLRDGYPQPSMLLTLRACLAERHLRQGDLERAAEYAGSALRLTRGGPAVLAELTRSHVEVCRSHLAADRFADAAASVAAAYDLMQERALHPAMAYCLLARARVRGRSGDVEGALADLGAARETAWPDDVPAITVELAGEHLAAGRLETAAALLDQIRPAVAAGTPLAAELRLQLGSLAKARGDARRAVEDLRAAVELATGLDARGVLVRALRPLSELLGETGKPAEAADVLRNGLIALGAEAD